MDITINQLHEPKRVQPYASNGEFFARWRSIPELGVTFQRFFAEDYILLVGVFKSVPKPGTGKKSDVNVYTIEIRRAALGAFSATAYCNGREVFAMMAQSKCAIEKLAFSSLRYWIYHKYRRTRLNRAAAGARVDPLTPEEELAETIQRQEDGQL